MKKVLALVLAVVLAFGMTTVAFAAFAKGDYVLNFAGFGVGYTDDDGEVDTATSVTPNSDVEPGTTIYYPVTITKYVDSGSPAVPTLGTTPCTKVSDASDFRISYSVTDGKNMLKSIKFVAMKDTTGTKGLYIAVETNDNFIMEDTTLALDAKISAKNGSSIDGIIQNTVTADSACNLNMTYGTQDIDNGFKTIDKDYVLSFDDDADDVTLCFDKDVEVSGNMKGQKDVLVRMKDSNDTIEEKYPDATIRFFDSTKDTFKRDVNVKIPYEAAVEKPYIYEVDAKGNLTKVDAKYDDVEGAFNFKAKTLGNYVLSDTELKSKVDADTDTDAPAEGDKPTDGTQPNPGTGANDFVGLAVALAVVSIAGIAVAKRK